MNRLLKLAFLVGLALAGFVIWKKLINKSGESTPVWSAANACKKVAFLDFGDDGDSASLSKALSESINFYDKVPADKQYQIADQTISAADLKDTLLIVREALSKHDLTDPFFSELREKLSYYKSAASTVLFTGYYEPDLRGSRAKTAQFKYPIFGVPDDLYQIDLKAYGLLPGQDILPNSLRGRLTADKKIVPYYSRDEIEWGDALESHRFALAWTDDLVELFFLQIQGSGIVTFPDGSMMRLGYADKNGQPYRAIGALLVKEGVYTKEEVSMQRIKEYLKSHPERLREILSYNPSYVFFKENAGEPVGSIGVPLTAMRSIATDQKLFPPGMLTLVRTEVPTFDENGTLNGWRKFQRLLLNQDTGGAIVGPGRADIFAGRGKEAELMAGHMRKEGEITFLIRNKS